MLKKDELRDPKSCLSKADPDEPVFVLRAKDKLAAQTVRLWATMANGMHEASKVAEAIALAEQMDRWRLGRAPDAPIPSAFKMPPSAVAKVEIARGEAAPAPGTERY